MSFIAQPPSPTWPSLKGAGVFLRRVLRYFWQPLVPFEELPRLAGDFPETEFRLEEGTALLEVCEGIFDSAEERRGQLEQKAQWTFTAVGLVTPSLASIFVFALNDSTFTSSSRAPPITLLSLSAAFMLLSYVSAARALWVRGREVLQLGSVIDMQTGEFLAYKAAERARGLLYCAAMNTAYNDHIAQFVRGAQVLAATAIILFTAGAVSTTFRPGPVRPLVVRIDANVGWRPSQVDMISLADALGSLATAITAQQQTLAQVIAVTTSAAPVKVPTSEWSSHRGPSGRRWPVPIVEARRAKPHGRALQFGDDTLICLC